MSSITQTPSNLSLVKKISTSKFPVYLGTEKLTNKYVALKTYPLQDKLFQREKNVLRTLNHPHIVKLESTLDQYTIGDQTVSGLALEYAAYGDLLSNIQKFKKMPEMLARTLFHQLVDALCHMYSKNVAHLDIKVENLLIDENFTLKLTDFDLAQNLDSHDHESKGTAGARAPEVAQGRCEDFKAADIYSLGIVLFIMVSGIPPYNETLKPSGYEFDAFYKLMRKDDDKFWKTHSKYRGNPEFYSKEFKELFKMMLEEDPEDRITIEEVKKNKWYQGPVYDEERCRDELRRYLQQN